MVRFGLDYACAHIIIPASVNLLPIQADFVTERVKVPKSEDIYRYIQICKIQERNLPK